MLVPLSIHREATVCRAQQKGERVTGGEISRPDGRGLVLGVYCLRELEKVSDLIYGVFSEWVCECVHVCFERRSM